mgnify:CR=1 FL=1
MSWGGVADAFTFGLTDFDNKGSSKGFWDWQFDPIGGGSDKKWGSEPTKGFDFLDAYDAFKSGYSNTMGAMGGSSPSGSKFLGDYMASRSQTPTTSSPVSTSSAFTAGGKTHTMPGVVIDKPVDFYAFKDNVQYPTQQGGGGSKGGGLLDTVAKGVGIAGGLKAAFPVTFAALCDIRTKTDISPLETTEVNDDLAQVAFFIKGLRERS